MQEVCAEWTLAFPHGPNDLRKVQKFNMHIRLKIEEEHYLLVLKKKHHPTSPWVRKYQEEIFTTFARLGALKKIPAVDEG